MTALLVLTAGTSSSSSSASPPAPCPPLTIGCKFTASYRGSYSWHYFETRPDKSTLVDSVTLSWRESWSRTKASWVLSALSGADSYADSADPVSACKGVLSWFTRLPSTIVGGPLPGSPQHHGAGWIGITPIFPLVSTSLRVSGRNLGFCNPISPDDLNGNAFDTIFPQTGATCRPNNEFDLKLGHAYRSFPDDCTANNVKKMPTPNGIDEVSITQTTMQQFSFSS